MNHSLFVQNVKYLVTCDNNDRLLENINILCENGVITYIGQDKKEADEIIDGRDMVMYPGLINTHHHLYQIFSRNLPQVQNMALFPWLKTLYEIWKNLDHTVVYHSALVGMGELLKTGCTTCVDHHYVFPASSSTHLLDHQIRAAGELNMRILCTRGSMDLSVKDGGLPPDSVVQTVDEILKDSEAVVLQYHDGNPYAMRQIALAPCSPFSVSEALLRETVQLARSLKVRLHTHLAETKDEENYTLSRYQKRPLAYMADLDWVGPDVWYAHGIHFNSEELDVLAETKTGVAHCPISNMKLSSGVARIPEMLARDIPVGLAVDGSASNDGSNLLEEMRVAYLLHRLHYGNTAPTGYDILKMATRGSARVIGRDDLGCIAIGKAADFFLIDLRQAPLVGAMYDPLSMLCTVGYKGPVTYTVVNGHITVNKGTLAFIDEEKLVHEANISLNHYLEKAK